MFVSTICYVKQSGNVPNSNLSVSNSQNQESVSKFNFTNNNEVSGKNNDFMIAIYQAIKNKFSKNLNRNKSINILG